MKLRSKEPFWLLKNGLKSSYPTLTEEINCEVLIIGCGITGALLSYQLASEGYETVAIDERDVGMGSTAASTSILQYELDVPLIRLIKDKGAGPAADVYLKGIESIEKLEHIITTNDLQAGFRKKESLYFSSSKKDLQWLQLEYQTRQQNGIDVSWLDQKEIQQTYGLLSHGAILSTAAASIDAYALTHELFSLTARKFSLRVFDHTAMKKVKARNNGYEIRTDLNVKITCRHIVFATGYESKSFLNENFVNLVSTYATVTEPIPALRPAIKNTLFWNTDDPYLYIRSTEDNRLLIGGKDEKFKNPVVRDSLIEEKERELLADTADLIPGQRLITDFSWAGTFGLTRDGLPFIGQHKDYPNCFFALGFGGNGITFSIMGMEIISDALKGRGNRFLEYFRFGR